MSWVDAKFDLNEAKGVEHVYFQLSTLGPNIPAYLSHGDGTKSIVSQSTYVDIIYDVKILCKGSSLF